MDSRTRTEKLMAMATQDESPEERDVARAKLATMGMWPPPPPPPAAVGGPFAVPDESSGTGWRWFYNVRGNVISTANVGGPFHEDNNITIRVTVKPW